MLLTFDAMTGRMEVCGEQRGADTDCEHPSGHGGAHDSNNVFAAVAESRDLGGRKLWRTIL